MNIIKCLHQELFSCNGFDLNLAIQIVEINFSAKCLAFVNGEAYYSFNLCNFLKELKRPDVYGSGQLDLLKNQLLGGAYKFFIK